MAMYWTLVLDLPFLDASPDETEANVDALALIMEDRILAKLYG